MPPKGFSCTQCGSCCLYLNAYYTCATDEDIALWIANERDDILEWVDEIVPGIYDIWISPRTGDGVGRCPWLRKLPRQERYICRIQGVKPGICKNYPLSEQHAKETGCPGFAQGA